MFKRHREKETEGNSLATSSSSLYEQLAKKLGMKNVCASFELLKTIVDNPVPGKLVDRLSGLRVAFVDSSFISYFLRSFEEILGQRVVDRIIKDSHVISGKHMVQIGKKMFGLKDELAFAFFFWLFSSVGWGKLKELEFDKEKLSGFVRWEDYGDTDSPATKRNPIHANLAGMICGAAEEVWEKPFEADEVSCAAQGNAYCEFRFNPKKGD